MCALLTMLSILLPAIIFFTAPSSAIPWLPSHQSPINGDAPDTEKPYLDNTLPYWSISLFNTSKCLPSPTSPASSAGFLNYAGTSSLPCAPIPSDAAYPLPSYYFTTTKTGGVRFKILFWISEDCGAGREEPAWDAGSNWNGCFGPVGMARDRVRGFSIEEILWDEVLKFEILKR
jgi:hypothetical protein